MSIDNINKAYIRLFSAVMLKSFGKSPHKEQLEVALQQWDVPNILFLHTTYRERKVPRSGYDCTVALRRFDDDISVVEFVG
jgi:hypothetical protein